MNEEKQKEVVALSLEFDGVIGKAQNLIFEICELLDDKSELLTKWERTMSYLIAIKEDDWDVKSVKWNRAEHGFEVVTEEGGNNNA